MRHRIVFLPNYDIAMAQPLYPGCDVWLNNPLRPYEACGTSGMKAALNGGLNLSILDGWWDEWYDGNNGWAIPSADGIDDPDRRDDIEAGALYDLIENDVAPQVLRRRRRRRAHPLDGDGAAHAEVARPQGARRPGWCATTCENLYTPAAVNARALNADYAGAATLAAWKKTVKTRLAGGARRARRESRAWVTPPRSATMLDVRAFVCLGTLSPDDVDVQVVHGVIDARRRARRHRRRLADPGRGLRRRPLPLRRHRRPRPHRRVRLHRARRAPQRPAHLDRRARVVPPLSLRR